MTIRLLSLLALVSLFGHTADVACGQAAPATEMQKTTLPAADYATANEGADSERKRLVQVEAAPVELRVPASYWMAVDPDELAEQMSGGCTPPRVPENLLLVLRHKDAMAEVWLVSSPRYLMRNRDDLEEYVGGFVQAVRQQLGESMSEVSTTYAERDSLIVHRFAFSVTPRTTGGCVGATQAPQAPEKSRFLLVDYFLRPEGEDGLHFRASCRASEEAFEALKSEFEFILSSFSFTGETAEEFFVPDAPAEKVPTADEAAEQVSVSKGQYGWILAAGAIVIIWMLLRRRKRSQAEV